MNLQSECIISEDSKNSFLFELHLRKVQDIIFAESSIDQSLKRCLPVSFSAKTDTQNLIGGICGWISYDYAYIDAIWIDKEHRNKALGRQLLQKFEQKALAEKCNKILVTSNSFSKSSDFWNKNGFILFCELPGQACDIQYLKKDLVL